MNKFTALIIKILMLHLLLICMVFSQNHQANISDSLLKLSLINISKQYNYEIMHNDTAANQENYERFSKTGSKKTKKDDTTYYMFSGGIGIATTDSVLKADYATIQFSIGFWKPSFVFPFSLNFLHSREISNSPNTNQTDIHLTTALPLGGGNVFLFSTLGPGISLGTSRNEKGENPNVQLRHFVSPSFLLESELLYSPDGNIGFGIKGFFNYNTERTLKSYMLSIRLFRPS